MKKPPPGLETRRGSGGAAAVKGAVILLTGLGACGPVETRHPAERSVGGTSGEQEERYGEDERAWKNARCEKERLDMRAQLDTLALSFAHDTAERDRIRFDRIHHKEPDEVAVREFDGRWGWVILDGGAGMGVRQGQVYGVFRGDNWVARIRVADVREQVSGAWVEDIRSGWTPASGDRAVREQRER